MKCPHCLINFHAQWHRWNIAFHGHVTPWSYIIALCPECDEFIIDLEHEDRERITVIPRGSSRAPAPTEVPPEIAEDYTEACQTLAISPKASAALSRRCLQSVLSGLGYKSKNLVNQVDQVLNEKDASRAIPSSLRTTIDAIRNFGNFSAHPITDTTTNQIIEVEDHEAEFCLDVIEELFDHAYVKPAQSAARKAALDAKLAQAGKPPSK